jgi:hypothetical protein
MILALEESIQKIAWFIYTKLYYAFNGTWIQKIAEESWDLFLQLWHFFVAGIIITSFMTFFWNEEKIKSFFTKSRHSLMVWIVIATLIGVISPLPIYVAIPVVTALFKVGIPVPILFSFLVASPLMNPILFTLTSGAMGYEMAFARLISAIILGITAGCIAYILELKKYLRGLVSREAPVIQRNADPEEKTFKAGFMKFINDFYRLTRFSLKYFLIGIMVGAAVKVLVPPAWIFKTLGSQNVTISVLLAVAGGIPLYACGGGTIPAMQALLSLGMNKGAILAFFISGPATKLSTLIALRAAIINKAFLIYLAISLIGATVIGLIYSLL